MIYIKEHKQRVLAACDSNLIGKTIGNYKITESFYKDKEVNEKEFIELLKKHKNINLVGNKVVEIAEKQGIIKTHDTISNVKIAIILSV